MPEAIYGELEEYKSFNLFSGAMYIQKTCIHILSRGLSEFNIYVYAILDFFPTKEKFSSGYTQNLGIPHCQLETHSPRPSSRQS
jgi:hypothetical protein